MYQIKFTISDKEYLDFNKYHLRTEPASKMFLLLLYLMCLVMPLPIIIKSVVQFEGYTVLAENVIIYLSHAVILMMAIAALSVLAVPIAVLGIKYLNKRGKMPYGEEMEMHFEEDYFLSATPGITSKNKYSLIKKIAVCDDCVYLFINSLKSFIIPLSAFDSIEQRESFQVFIQEKVELAKKAALQ